MQKIAIIGAGACGIMTAINAKWKNPKLDIVIFEANEELAKKLLVSGNGKCNISNAMLCEEDYFGEDTSLVAHLISKFSFKDFEYFCKKLSIYLQIKQNNKVYPSSNEARNVLWLLNKELEKLEIKISFSCKITDIKLEQNQHFALKSFEKDLGSFEKIVICSGLGAKKSLGGNEDALNFAKTFKLKTNPSYPSLVGIKLDTNYHHKLAGLKVYSKLSLYENKNKIASVKGDVLFTKYGLSGFGILDISQSISYTLMLKKKLVLEIDFLAGYLNEDIQEYSQKNLQKNSKQELENIFLNTSKDLETLDILSVLFGIIPKKLAKECLNILHIDKEKKVSELKQNEIKAIITQLSSWKFYPKETAGFEHAEVSGGGIKISEINIKTLEAKGLKNLFFGGECLDIVGKRGGFNLHFAWGCGFLIAKALSKKV